MKFLTHFISLTAMAAFINFIPSGSFAQEEADTAFIFETVAEVAATPVKDQHRSGTCWSFGGISFLESEALRVSGKETDLSEMFIVRHAYADKGLKYVRLHGSSNFGPGGQAHDVTNVIRNYGIVPETFYAGLEIGEDKHNHGEMDAVLKGVRVC